LPLAELLEQRLNLAAGLGRVGLADQHVHALDVEREEPLLEFGPCLELDLIAMLQELVKAALSRSSTLRPADPTFTDMFPSLEQLKKLVSDPIAYHYQHRDGLRCTMLLMNGLVRDFTFAATIEGQSKPLSTQMYLPMPDGRTTLASFFSPLVHNAEVMFLTGKAQYPIERTLLTSGLLIAGIESYNKGFQKLETPYLADVKYQPNPESTFWRT